MKLLMITSRNIDKKGGENALIVGRHAELYRTWGVKTDVLFFHKDNALEMELGDGIRLAPTSKTDIMETVKKRILSKAYQGVVISGVNNRELNALLLELKKETPFVIILDIHATIREIYEYCVPDLYHRVGTRVLYLKKRRIYKETLRITDYAFVVSDESVSETNTFCGDEHINYLKIRCGCNETLDVQDYLAKRQKVRQELGADDNTLAFVYSGSKDRWQKYADTVSLFEKIASNNENCMFAFYMNLTEQDKAELADRLGADRVVVRWVKPEQMLDDLTGYDVGMLLRDKNWTNKVAFPNKFSDYIRSGLALVMTDAISEPHRIAKAYGMDVLEASELVGRDFCAQYNKKRNEHLREYIDKCKTVVEKELLYGCQVASQCEAFVETLRDIEGGGNNG